MQIRDIMSHPVRTVRAAASVQEAAELMALHDVGALAVCHDDALVGIVTDRDILMRCLAPGISPTKTEVNRIMTTEPVVIAPSAELEDATRILTGMRIRRLPVVEEGHPVGMVTMDDVARQSQNDAAVLMMVRRNAPRTRSTAPVAQARG
jgi:CBS domain-containing protein